MGAQSQDGQVQCFDTELGVSLGDLSPLLHSPPKAFLSAQPTQRSQRCRASRHRWPHHSDPASMKQTGQDGVMQMYGSYDSCPQKKKNLSKEYLSYMYKVVWKIHTLSDDTNHTLHVSSSNLNNNCCCGCNDWHPSSMHTQPRYYYASAVRLEISIIKSTTII